MSIYYCDHCEKHVDGDWVFEYPSPGNPGMSMCENCLTDLGE